MLFMYIKWNLSQNKGTLSYFEREPFRFLSKHAGDRITNKCKETTYQGSNSM